MKAVEVAVKTVATTIPAADQQMRSGAIDLDQYVTLLESSDVIEKIDIGVAVVIKAIHAIYGLIVLVNGTGAQSAVIFP